MMGLEEHLLGMFRDDFEFHDGAAPSHLGHAPTPRVEAAELALAEAPAAPSPAAAPLQPGPASWTAEAEKELGRIPFFVRGKARRNTERFATERGIASITVETLYDAKAHYSR
jgi:light-independent protochlorophyllide reductase subunit B